MTLEAETEIQEKIAYHVREILKLLGEDPDREGLKETPNRVARAVLEMTSALRTEMPPMKVFRISERDVITDPNQIVDPMRAPPPASSREDAHSLCHRG